MQGEEWVESTPSIWLSPERSGQVDAVQCNSDGGSSEGRHDLIRLTASIQGLAPFNKVHATTKLTPFTPIPAEGEGRARWAPLRMAPAEEGGGVGTKQGWHHSIRLSGRAPGKVGAIQYGSDGRAPGKVGIVNAVPAEAPAPSAEAGETSRPTTRRPFDDLRTYEERSDKDCE